MHTPSALATLLVTLHIPPHNPTCLFTLGSCMLPEPLPHSLDNNTLSSTPTQLLDYFLHFALPAPPAPCLLSARLHPGSSCGTTPTLDSKESLTPGWEWTPQGWKAGCPSASFPGPQFPLVSFRLEEKGRGGAAEEVGRAGVPRGLKFSCTVQPHHTSPATGWAGDREVS